MQYPRPSSPRVGVVGAGYWGPNLIRNLADLPGSPLAAVADSNSARLDALRGRYPSLTLHNSAAELFADPRIDAVVIATPAETHYTLARDALTHGKHAFVEKPLATSGADCLELARLAEARGLTLMTGHTFLHNDALRWARGQVEAGTLGDVMYLYSRRLNLGQVRQDINVVWNLAPHDLSIMGFLTGARPTRATCTGYAYLQPGVEDVAFITLEYPPNIPGGTPRSAHVHVSWLDPHKVREVVIVGTRQMIVYDDVDADRVIQVYDKGVDRVPAPGQPNGTGHPDPRERAESYGDFKLMLRWGDLHVPRLRVTEPLRNEMSHFVHCVATGDRPLTDAVNGWEIVRILEACDESLAHGGAPVDIDWTIPNDAPAAFHGPRVTL
jgi:predicted dehydrogenase